jgi:hypothetical protein
MFDHFDADRSGQLDMGELRELVVTILPGFAEGQLHYFQVGTWAGGWMVE